MKTKITVLFHRNFRGFTGGHLKVWNYYQHIQSNNKYKSEIFFTKGSSWINNPWVEEKALCLKHWNPDNIDILFIAGMDWLALEESRRLHPPSPIINLIQSVRHSDQESPLYEFLKYPAIRICVSQEVADSIKATKIVNGPVFVNSNGINHDSLPSPLADREKTTSLLIIGMKNPELSQQIYKNLNNNGVYCVQITDYLPRNEFLSLVNKAKIVVLLPMQAEGFYLPALEAMYMKTLVICPDCIGNRSFCKNGITCYKPIYSAEMITKAVFKALSLTTKEKRIMLSMAKRISLEHSIEKERDEFLILLSRVVTGKLEMPKELASFSNDKH